MPHVGFEPTPIAIALTIRLYTGHGVIHSQRYKTTYIFCECVFIIPYTDNNDFDSVHQKVHICETIRVRENALSISPPAAVRILAATAARIAANSPLTRSGERSISPHRSMCLLAKHTHTHTHTSTLLLYCHSPVHVVYGISKSITFGHWWS